MTRAARAIKIACDNRKIKSYRVNRPLLEVCVGGGGERGDHYGPGGTRRAYKVREVGSSVFCLH